MRIVLLAAALGIAVYPSLTIAQDAPSTPAEPCLFCPQAIQDVGEVDANASPTVRFSLVNKGQATLTFGEIRTGCGCTAPKVNVKELPPGGETALEATISFRNRKGMQKVLISVESNDPETPVYTLEISGKVRPALTISPRVADFGEVLDDDAHVCPLILRSMVPDEAFRVLSIEMADLVFQSVVKEIQAGKEYEIRVSTSAPLPLGNHYGVMYVVTDHPLYPKIQVNAQARCIGDLRVEPATVRIPDNPGSGLKANQFLRLGAGRIRNFRLIDVVVPFPSMRAEIVQRGNNQYFVKLLDMPTDGSLAGKSLIVKTDSPDKPEVSIPFEICAAKASSSL